MTTEHINELLPIGSVVSLHNSHKSLMIFGICQSNSENNTDYDYIAVMYPEGNISPKMQFMFNHSDIETVEFRGYEDDERTALMGKLINYYATHA